MKNFLASLSFIFFMIISVLLYAFVFDCEPLYMEEEYMEISQEMGRQFLEEVDTYYVMELK